MRVVFAETRPTSAPENAKEGVIGLNMHEPIKRCFLVDNRGRHTVNEIACSKEGFIPVPKGKLRVSKKSKTGLY